MSLETADRVIDSITERIWLIGEHPEAGRRANDIAPGVKCFPAGTKHEMVYIGGGAGMAPLRAHLSHLLESEGTARRITYWYGARSRQEIFYEEYFRKVEEDHPNFSFHLALSSPLQDDNWRGPSDLFMKSCLKSTCATIPILKKRSTISAGHR